MKPGPHEIILPASKSISNRALIIQAMQPQVLLNNLSDADDTQVLQQALKNSAATVDVGHAGTAMRFLLAYFAAIEDEKILTGSARMQQRPIAELVEVLRQMGANISYDGEEGFPPLRICGKSLQGGIYTIPANVSSQFISALLLIAPTLAEPLRLQLQGEVVSQPYIQMTLELMSHFGAYWEWEQSAIIVNNSGYKAKKLLVENDWTAASYWYALAAVTPDAEFMLRGITLKSLQGDRVCAELMRSFGVETEEAEGGLLIRNSDKKSSQSFSTDFCHTPDLAQTFAVLCAAVKMPFHITRLSTLRIKETDRLAAMQTELRKLGVMTEAGADFISSTSIADVPQHEIRIETYSDHRMAMAFAVFEWLYSNVKVQEKQVVTKSYPGFWEQFDRLKKLVL